MLKRFREKYHRPDVFAGILFFLLATGLTAPGENLEEQNWFKAVGRRDWLANYDPTLIGRRITSEFSYEDDRGSKSTAKLDLTIRDAWGLFKGLAFGIQADLPLKWMDTGGDSIAGAGDFGCRTGVVGRITRTFRWGTGMNFKFPTATNSALGDGYFEIRPIVALSWDASSWVNIGINAAYSITPSNTSSVNKLEINFPVAMKISDDWSAALTYKPTLHFEPDSATHSLELDVTRLLGRNHEFAITPGMEIPLSVQSLEWKAILGLAWYF